MTMQPDNTLVTVNRGKDGKEETYTPQPREAAMAKHHITAIAIDGNRAVGGCSCGVMFSYPLSVVVDRWAQHTEDALAAEG